MKISGRVLQERYPGADEQLYFGATYLWAGPDGEGAEPHGFRTWETEPAGWFLLTGAAGRYTLIATHPAGFIRPRILTNLYMQDHDAIDLHVTPLMDVANYDENAWDEKPASHYFQTFVAQGSSVTSIGFKLATDGVDGIGPMGQNVLLSVHKKGQGTPDTWEQVGATGRVNNVDCGGAKNYTWSVAWNSGEIPTTPGEVYAVHLRPEDQANGLQAFWREDEDRTSDCYRIGADGAAGWQSHDIWLGVGTDGDGLLIPYNKRVHTEYKTLAGGGKKWSQTYVSQGKGLASVILYAALGTAEPPLHRQRCIVRVRKGGPDGPVVGVEKLSIGNGDYTGDASWGMFGVTYSPGEVSLDPGTTYAIEFESIEHYETLHGYTNIKGVVSSEVPGFNPYQKHAPDDYALGDAYHEGKTKKDFDLDMQIIEYAHPIDEWARAVHSPNLLQNGDMEAGELDEQSPSESKPAAWARFAVDPETTHMYLADGKEKRNRIIRVIGGGFNNKTVDGGYVQRVDGLSRAETYRLTGKVRCSWPIDEKHRCDVGYDPTGQTDDPEAATIVWTILPKMHGAFVDYTSDPIRPTGSAVSVWLRARTSLTSDYPFKADFDDFKLRQVRTSVPQPMPGRTEFVRP